MIVGSLSNSDLEGKLLRADDEFFPDARFALMDAEITDLTSSGAAEMVVGPVVFDNFVLDHPGR